MKKGIFYNSPKASCSIHESGLMCYQALSLSAKYSLVYTEQQSIVDGDFDFVIFNHHPWTNSWMVPFISTITARNFAIVTEVGDYSNLFPLTPYPLFDEYIVLDPTIPDIGNIYGFPRPLEQIQFNAVNSDEIVIGSFGFATEGKNWEEIIVRTQIEFDNAIIRLNIPRATCIVDNQEKFNYIKKSCQSLIYKPGIELQITHEYHAKPELVQWCAQNTLNVFLYSRNQSGLSATTDQAIIAERPMLVSDNPTFRHILQYLHPLPSTFREAIEKTLPMVQEMKKDWSAYNFAQKFESIIYR
jgi:hypothetical protein